MPTRETKLIFQLFFLASEGFYDNGFHSRFHFLPFGPLVPLHQPPPKKVAGIHQPSAPKDTGNVFLYYLGLDPAQIDRFGLDQRQGSFYFIVEHLADDHHEATIQWELRFQVTDFEPFEKRFQQVGYRVDIVVDVLLIHNAFLAPFVKIFVDLEVGISINGIFLTCLGPKRVEGRLLGGQYLGGRKRDLWKFIDDIFRLNQLNGVRQLEEPLGHGRVLRMERPRVG